MFRHILVPTDGSKLAGKAVAEAVKLASVLGSRLTFLTVLVPLNALGDYEHAFSGAPENVRHAAIQFLEADSKAALNAALSVAKSAGLTADTAWVESHYPHEAIIAAAKSMGADLIVMASHGRGGAKAVILGSVTQKVLSQTHLPVLVVR